MPNLKNKVVLITGASSGFGEDAAALCPGRLQGLSLPRAALTDCKTSRKKFKMRVVRQLPSGRYNQYG
ncbi:hypothetical protein [Candidatus Villigracilis saccharophilus]|uniref:hypothetical protein n=1 Tax=Candidatus Villigracilis saccharophilus TaxID=3140684 RepID=UPI00313527A9|nr:hypothetical protein [Anaerolineales bacterium]